MRRIGAARQAVRKKELRTLEIRRFISGLAAAWLAASASGQAAFDLIEADLGRLPIRLAEITSDTIVWDHPTGDAALVPLENALGLVAGGGDVDAGASRGRISALGFERSILRLTDGRRLTGSLSAQEELPETLRWQHPLLGAVDVPLEQIDRLVLQRATVGPASVDVLPSALRNDVVLLRNGDRLEGFVAALGRDAVIEIEGREVVVPMESVQQVALANPRETWSGPMVWLRDGSVLAATEVRFEDGHFVLINDSIPGTEADAADAGQSVAVRSEHVSAVSFDTGRLVPLARLIDTPSPASVGGTFGATTIGLSGGVSIPVRLSAGARRLSLTAELPLRSRAWGRCTLVLRTDGEARARFALSAADPVIDFDLDITNARTLELVLEPGEFGRVQTDIEIRDALIAVD